LLQCWRVQRKRRKRRRSIYSRSKGSRMWHQRGLMLPGSLVLQVLPRKGYWRWTQTCQLVALMSIRTRGGRSIWQELMQMLGTHKGRTSR
jgi:hypothetical protein